MEYQKSNNNNNNNDKEFVYIRTMNSLSEACKLYNLREATVVGYASCWCGDCLDSYDLIRGKQTKQDPKK